LQTDHQLICRRIVRLNHKHCNCSILGQTQKKFKQDYRISTAQKMTVNKDGTPYLLFLIKQKLLIV